MIRCSCVSGISGVNYAHVFISSGENVCLSCNNTVHDCTSTTWIYNRFRDSAAVELIRLGIKKKNTESHERLSLGSDCSLNINNISTEDYGVYICQQWTGVNRDQQQGTDARVFLHVLHGNFMIIKIINLKRVNSWFNLSWWLKSVWCVCYSVFQSHPHRLRSVQVSLWLSSVSCIHILEALVMIGSVLREFSCSGWIRLVLNWIYQTPDIRYHSHQITVSSLWIQHSWMKMTTESGDVKLLREIKSRPQSHTLLWSKFLINHYSLTFLFLQD